MRNSFLHLLLSISLTVAPQSVWSENSQPTPISDEKLLLKRLEAPQKALQRNIYDYTYDIVYEMDVFIDEYQAHLTLPLPDSEIAKALADSGIEATFNTVLETGFQPSKEEHADAIEKIWASVEDTAQIQQRVYQLVDNLYSNYQLKDINNILRHLLAEYATHPKRRDGLNLILRTMGQYRFNEAQLKKMEKQKRKLHQWTKGTATTTGIVIVAGWLFLTRHRTKAVLETLVNKTKSYSTKWKNPQKEIQPTIKNTATGSKEKGSHQGTTHEEFLKTHGPVGPNLTLKNISSEQTHNLVQATTSIKQRRRFFNLDMRQGIINAMALAGVSAAGGGVNVGFHALYKSIFGDDLTMNSDYINPDQYKAEYYDALATLSLECRTEDLLKKVQETEFSQLDLKQVSKSWNELFLEKANLSTINPYYISRRQLPEEVRIDSQTGLVHFKLDINNVSFSEEAIKKEPSLQQTDNRINTTSSQQYKNEATTPLSKDFFMNCPTRQGQTTPHYISLTTSIANLNEAREALIEKYLQSKKAIQEQLDPKESLKANNGEEVSYEK